MLVLMVFEVAYVSANKRPIGFPGFVVEEELLVAFGIFVQVVISEFPSGYRQSLRFDRLFRLRPQYIYRVI